MNTTLHRMFSADVNIAHKRKAAALKCLLTGIALLFGLAANAQCTAPTATVVNNTSCSSGNGTVTVTAPTPLASFEFSKDGGTTWQPGNVFSSLSGGNYAVVARMTDLSCTSAAVNFTVTNAPAVVTAPTSTNVNPTSCLTPDGSITISGGPTPLASYQFSIDNGLTFQAGTAFTSLAAGTYAVVAKSNATGCVSSVTTVTLTSPAITTPTATTGNPTSCVTPNGTITFTAPTPFASFTFSIDNGASFQSSNAFTNVAAGIYQVRARNTTTGCVSVATTVTLTNPTITTPTVTSTNITSCNSNNGTITVTAPTPLANYQFSNDLGTTFQSSNVFSGLAAGNYGIVAKQVASGCVSNITYVSLTSVPVLPATPTATTANPTSCSTPNGTITVTAPTPLANYEFSMDNGASYQSSNIFNGLTGGTYAVRVRTIATSCVSAAVNKTLTNPAVTAPTATPVAPTACNVTNGIINVTAPTPLANYQFSNDSGATFQANAQFTGLAPGVYHLITKNNASGCTSAVANVTVTNPAATTPTTGTPVNNTICSGTPNGSITVTAPTPLANYLFSKDNGVTFQASNVFSNLTAGTYQIRVKQISTDCVSAAVSKAVTNAPAAVTAPTATPANPNSCAIPNGSITITAPTPLANYQFSINNGASYQSSNSFTSLPAGAYQARVKLISTGCVSTATAVTLTSPAVTAPTTGTPVNNTICSGTPNGSITVTAPTPLANYTFSKDNGVTFQAGSVFSNLAAGTYLIRVKLTSTGCVSSSVSKAVTLAPAAVASPTLTPVQPTSCVSPNGSVTVTPSPNVPANFLYSKDNGITFQSSNVFTGLAPGAYQFRTKLISTGCTSAAVASTLTSPAVTAPTATTVNNVNCSGTPSGSITVTAPTPLANYTFSKDNGVSFQAGNVFSNVAAGSYNVRVMSNATGCMSAATAKTITNATVAVTAPTATVSNPLNCAPDDGAITVTAPVPLTSYIFSIDNGTTFQSSNVFTGLAGATYKVKVQSIATGCISTATSKVMTAAPTPAMPTVTKVNATTCTGDGSLTITAPSPLANYTFSDNNGTTFQSAPVFSNLGVGIYKVIAKSTVNGCSSPVNQQALSTSAVCTEICNNNIDDDKDGLTDNMDPDCACNGSQFNSGCSSTCTYQPTADTFTIKQLYSTPASGITVYQTPMVGDVDNDGVNEILILSTDNYTVTGTGPTASLNYRNARDISVFSGKTGTLKSTIPTVDANGVGYDVGWSGFPAIALANVDDDLQSEVIVLSAQSDSNVLHNDDAYLFCYGADGTFKWKSSTRAGYATMTHRNGAAINVADFNGDGIPEVYLYDQVFNARTGVLLAQGGGTRGMSIANGDLAGTVAIGVPSHPVAADLLPNSPGLELACGRTVYTVNITNTAGTAGNSMTPTNAPALAWGAAASYVKDGFTSVADMDADGALDVVVTWGDTTKAMVYVWNPRTATIMSKADVTQITASAFCPGAAFVGNFDSDCGLEIGFCLSSRIATFDYAPGTMTSKWTLVTTDGSGITGLTLFDFNQDGKAEIVYRDQDNIRILDATTGVDVATPIPCTSGTGLEMPVVADVKGNGTSQICVTCNTLGATGSVNVYSSSSQPWAPARGVWNQQCYHVTNINDDLSVPLTEYNGATALAGTGCTGCKNTPYNNFLQQATFRTQQGCVQFPAADAVASNVSVIYGCDSSHVSYTISNNADVGKLPAGTPVAFYSGDPGQAGAVLIGRDSLPADLAPGASVNLTQGLVLTPLGPSFTLYVIANDTGTTASPVVFPVTSIPECNYANNDASGLLVIRPTSGANPPTICEAGSVTLSATGGELGMWTFDPANPDTNAVIIYPDSLVTTVTNLDTGGTYNYIWNFNGCKDTVTVLVNTTPDAGPDKSIDCITTDIATMEATGDATWTFAASNPGTAVFSDPAFANTTVSTFSAAGTYTLIWTDTIGCSDTAQIFAYAVCTPLALDLLSFDAAKTGNQQVLLTWRTANEQNTSRFIIEKSKDASLWHVLGTVKAAGNSVQERSYSFTDASPQNGVNYYRLRMMDIDGSYKLSQTRSVTFNGIGNTVNLAPNPTTGRAVLSCAQPLENDATVSVWNSMGLLVKSYVVSAGTAQYDIDMSDMPKGVYLVDVKGTGISTQIKLLVK